MTALQLNSITIVIAVLAMSTCGRNLNYVFFTENEGLAALNQGGIFETSVFDDFVEDVSGPAYASEYTNQFGFGIADKLANLGFAAVTSVNGTTGIPSVLAGGNGNFVVNENVSYTYVLDNFQYGTADGPGDVFFQQIGTSSVQFVGNNSDARFDFAASGSLSSDGNTTTGAITNGLALAQDGFSTSLSTVCAGPSCLGL